MSCIHLNKAPYEFRSGKIFLDDEYGDKIDWRSNMINAHIIRVTKYICLDCLTIISVPLETGDNDA
jgi:hypothetical protein